MAKPPPLGSINARSVSNAKLGNKPFIFDGTISGLTRAALKAGAEDGSKIEANFGLGFRAYQIVAAPHDDRCGGFWAEREA